VCMCLCMHTHTHTLHVGYSDVNPGVATIGIRHLECQRESRLTKAMIICRSYMCSKNICNVYILGCGMKSGLTPFLFVFLLIYLLFRTNERKRCV